jgi:hypothetical protein
MVSIEANNATLETDMTNNEIAILKACLNYETREEQLSDNFSNGDVDEFTFATGLNEQQVGGVMTSLTKKGYGSYDEDDDIFWLTEAGVNAIFDIIEAE